MSPSSSDDNRSRDTGDDQRDVHPWPDDGKVRPLSVGMGAAITCSGCSHRSSITLWVLINELDRPDLIEEVCRGTIRSFRCDSCGEVADLQGPLMIFRPTRSPRHLLAVSSKSVPTDELRRDADLVVRAVAAFYGDAFEQDWFEGFVPVEWAKLPEVLHAENGGFEDWQIQPASLLELYKALVLADQWEGTRAVIEQHPETLGMEMDKLIGHMIRRAHEAGAEDRERLSRDYLQILRRCREDGIEETFAWLESD